MPTFFAACTVLFNLFALKIAIVEKLPTYKHSKQMQTHHHNKFAMSIQAFKIKGQHRLKCIKI